MGFQVVVMFIESFVDGYQGALAMALRILDWDL